MNGLALLATWADAVHAESIVRLMVASLLGGLIGLEREHHGRSAGLRTQLLVALGSCLAMLVSLHFGDVYGAGGGSAGVRVDPARVAYGVMAGVGFLGAGAIIQYGVGVRGLTTAASLWCSAAIGLAAGFGMYVLASACTALVLFALMVLDKAEHCVPVRLTKIVTVIVPDTSPEFIPRYREILSGLRVRVVNVTYTQDFKGAQSVVTFTLSGRNELVDRAIDALRRAENITLLKVE